MSQEKSQIDSFDISFGSSPEQGTSRKQLEKWNILVCSDLGYVSKKAVSVRISEWNEFMAAQNIVVSGTIEENPQAAKKPLYVEFPVKSMKDLSIESIIANAAPFAAYSRAVFSLQQLIAGKTNTGDSMAMIKKAGLPHDEEDRALGLLASPSPSRQTTEYTKPAVTKQNSSLDNILSMINDAPSGPGAASVDKAHNVTDALFRSVTVSRDAGFDAKAVNAYIRECQSRLNRMADSVRDRPFYASRASSWNCLSTLAKIIGRKKEVSLGVASAPRQDMEENLPQILSSCMESGCAPDLIVWDYGVSFTNASMEAMARIAEIADQYKCVAIAPLSFGDPFFDGISERDSIVHLFDDVRMLPFKKLRAVPAARCLCLCGPGLLFAGPDRASGGNCCWFIATRWTEMLLGENDPFSTKDPRPHVESVFSHGARDGDAHDASFSHDIAPSVAVEAAAMGLTLFDRPPGQAALDKVVSVIGREQAAERYASLLFNLVVNRTVRLAGVKLLAAPGAQGAQNAHRSLSDSASVLEQFLRTELSAYGVISNNSQVVAAPGDDAKITVTIDSDMTVSGHTVQFSFSF